MSSLMPSGATVGRSLANDIKLAYLRIASPRANLYIGGLMVVDSRGLPLEFRYSEPIQPTKLQQILYGAALTPYLKRDVILDTLLKQLETRPRCLIVSEDSLVGVTSHKPAVAILRLSETNTAPIGSTGTWQPLSEAEGLLQITEQASPIRVYHPFEPFDEHTMPASLVDILEAGKSMPVVEPLSRIDR
ncbi:MAG: hypothetical protein VKK59_02545, partial [Vampirovibrionales bacterium]|nr:hypothetical protein [Vampirovibrionales bacterium]